MERYERGRTLGEGTFGVVHEARVREVRAKARKRVGLDRCFARVVVVNQR